MALLETDLSMEQPLPQQDIIVIGASAGGVEALTTIARALPPTLPAAVFVVLHGPADSPSLLPISLDWNGPLPAVHAADYLPIQHGHIYVAPADHHLIVDHGHMRVVRGPKENRHRPAVDPLFRSAAQAYGPRVVGVVLTGALDDGTAGLCAIKQCGGVAVVQDPNDALYRGMPSSALRNVDVDYCVPLKEIGPLLTQIAGEPVEVAPHSVPELIEREVIMATGMEGEAQHMPLGTPSVFSCPECGGVLHEMHDGDYVYFRCRVGHAFGTESMLAEQGQALEQALWSALNTLEETANLSRRLARQAQERGQAWLAERYHARSQDAERNAAAIRQVLDKEQATLPDPSQQPV